MFVVRYRHSLVSRPLPHFQCCNIETWEWPVDKATIDRDYDDVDKNWSSIKHMPYASAPSINHVIWHICLCMHFSGIICWYSPSSLWANLKTVRLSKWSCSWSSCSPSFYQWLRVYERCKWWDTRSTKVLNIIPKFVVIVTPNWSWNQRICNYDLSGRGRARGGGFWGCNPPPPKMVRVAI